jgi:hypothetical protein
MLAQCEADELNQQQQQQPTLQPVIPTAVGNGVASESLLSKRSQVCVDLETASSFALFVCLFVYSITVHECCHVTVVSH